MIEYPNYNKALITTGDRDFHCLVKYLNEHAKLAYLLVPNQKKYSALLKKVAPGKLLFMNNLKGKLEYKKRRPRLSIALKKYLLVVILQALYQTTSNKQLVSEQLGLNFVQPLVY